MIDPKFIWKYRSDGTERPIQEQLDRRKSDLQICLNQIAWYDKHPLHVGVLHQSISNNRRHKHLNDIQADILRLEKILNNQTI